MMKVCSGCGQKVNGSLALDHHWHEVHTRTFALRMAARKRSEAEAALKAAQKWETAAAASIDLVPVKEV